MTTEPRAPTVEGSAGARADACGRVDAAADAGPLADTAFAAGSSADADERRWAAVCSREQHGDLQFFYSVRSTGIYCRPSCASRRPLRANVRFHETREEAEASGFRPCKRCRPDLPESAPSASAALVARACRHLDAADEPPTLDALAALCGISPHHLHRMFKRETGVTPRAYAAERRAGRLRDTLAQAPSEGGITAAYLDAGFGSSAGFYTASSAMLGMTPRQFSAGGAQARIRFAVGRCSLGDILVAATDVGICAISLGDDANRLVRELQDRFPQAELAGDDAAFDEWVARVIGFVDAPAIGLDLPLDVRGTAFQRRVWEALRAIPPGSTLSYTDIADRLGVPKAVRAVAGACAANTIAVAIPCHRVVRSDGSLSGYRWGVERKRSLLAAEGLQEPRVSRRASDGPGRGDDTATS